MSAIVESIRGEFARYRGLAEAAIKQLSDADLQVVLSLPGRNREHSERSAEAGLPRRSREGSERLAEAGEEGNSIATICWHVSGNLKSRFTDFLTTDGEKPWRKRDEEFERRAVTREELLAHWAGGWGVLEASLATLTDNDFQKTITIRQQPMPVHEALLRSLAHTAYHVGQIVFIAKSLRGAGWTYLSIPPGQSDAYNRKPQNEHGGAHAASLADRKTGGA